MADEVKSKKVSKPRIKLTNKTIQVPASEIIVPPVVFNAPVLEPVSPQEYDLEPQYAADLEAAAAEVKAKTAKIALIVPSKSAQANKTAAAPAKTAASVPYAYTAAEPSAKKPTSKLDSSVNINNLLKLYLANVTKESVDQELELEVKFGTYGVKSITRINYDNIMKKLLASGFTIVENLYLLRIQNEYRDQKTGRVFQSNIRTEINGLQNIRLYCQTNKLDSIETGISFIQKSRFNNDLKSADVNDFNFRVSLNKETRLTNNSHLVKTMLEKWEDQKKTFRYLNRFKLKHPSLPVLVDMSIVKDSRKQGRFYVPEYNIHDAGVFKAVEKYEVEIETINQLVGIGTAFNTPENLNGQVLKPVIKYVLSGLQETNYPVSYPEQNAIMQDYMRLLWGKDYNENNIINASNFVGPSSYTLEIKNIKPLNTESAVPNIREHYTVTDKADGDRKLLFIAPNGRIYLINTNMDIQFTGTLSKNKDIWNTLLDGEHILYDKKKKFINMYAAFDIYYIAGKDIRANAFVSENADDIELKYRLPMLETIIKNMNATSIVNAAAPIPLKITNKRFYVGSAAQSIFQGCTFILSKERDGLFEYETDGLIFTPANLGVASNKIGEYMKPIKMTWDYSFKWKPAKFNTIDFLISVKKNENGTDIVGSVFNDGISTALSSQIAEYKTIILRVGFDESKHGFVNPYQDVIDDKIPKNDQLDYKDKYVPMQFFPTDPSDYKAGICHLLLTGNAGMEKNMYTENNEIIEDNMIVEFRYDFDREEQWRWVPLRVRYDKTAQLRNGEKNFGNAFHVANSNWHSIHNPITQMMIMSGENIPDELSDADVYYNKVKGTTKTRALRDFHNVYIKNALIKSVAKPGNTLIDLAVGKGGDWPKWIDAKLKFVFGIDISRDNIQNRLDGACARYLNYRKRYNSMPSALFVNGNSSVNIKKTTGILIDKDKQITRAVFGQGPKDAKVLGQGVYKHYGVGADGFDVCSIQFAIHYMFENQETLQNFLQNVSEVTKEGGYFIGTSYDGELLFNMLKKLPENESKVIMDNNETTGEKKKIWELIKRYDRAEFNADDSCVGYAVDVFQESINQTIREYLVNYTYLTRILENYGFVLVTAEELKKLNSSLTAGTGLFSDLFNKMNEEIRMNNTRNKSPYGEAPYMTSGERTISFLNRYFIYKKVRKVSDVEKVSLNLQHKTAEEAKEEAAEAKTFQKVIEKSNAPAPIVEKTGVRKKLPGKTLTKKTAVAAAKEPAPAPAPVEEPEPVIATAPLLEKKPARKIKRVITIKEAKNA